MFISVLRWLAASCCMGSMMAEESMADFMTQLEKEAERKARELFGISLHEYLNEQPARPSDAYCLIGQRLPPMREMSPMRVPHREPMPVVVPRRRIGFLP